MKIKNESRVVPIGWTYADEDAIQQLSNEYSLSGQHTMEPDATNMETLPIFAGRLCYLSFGDKAGRKTAESYLGHIQEVNHTSVIEHPAVSFFIDGISRSCSHEMVTHRHQSKSQVSQRYVAPKELGFVVPPEYRGDVEALERLKEIWAHTTYQYRELLDKETPDMSSLEKKIVREAARSVLPNSTETAMVWSGNLTSWNQLLYKRMDISADQEIRELAYKIYAHLNKYAPHVFPEKGTE